MKTPMPDESSKTARKIPGLSIWKNPRNNFACVRLHYTADPAKRSEEWKKRAFFGMDAKAIQTEFEIGWETYAGEAVYGKEFNREIHVLPKRREPDPEYRTLIRGWDFAGNHSCVVIQYVRGQIFVVDEYANMGFNTRRIAKEVMEDCNLRYGSNFRYVEVCDPSGAWEGKTVEGRACFDVMRELGMDVHPGIQEPTRRIDSVMKYLVSMVKGKPALMLNPECKMLIDGFVGGYHYPEKETQSQKRNKPEKNEYSHIHDGLQYACTRVLDVGNPERYLGDININNFNSTPYDL